MPAVSVTERAKSPCKNLESFLKFWKWQILKIFFFYKKMSFSILLFNITNQWKNFLVIFMPLHPSIFLQQVSPSQNLGLKYKIVFWLSAYCLLVDCLLVDCLLVDCLLVDCLLVDCLLVDCLLVDCLSSSDHSGNYSFGF